jgi:hypothetical protein
MSNHQSSQLDQKIHNFIKERSIWGIYSKYVRERMVALPRTRVSDINDEVLRYEHIDWKKSERVQSF